MTELTIALAGNPNAGKSTIFNALTGLQQHVGNWPGKTVEKKEGRCRHNGTVLNVVDLPGTYSLAAYSPDELIARDFVIEQKPDAVVNVLDATNLERNLYLTVQLLELGVPVILALNMIDSAQAQGIQIDATRLSRLLGGVPVVPIAASKGQGIDELIAITVQQAQKKCPADCGCQNSCALDYGPDVNQEVARLTAVLQQDAPHLEPYQPDWLALKLLEQDPQIVARAHTLPHGPDVLALARERAGYLSSLYGDDVDILTADQRYGVVHGLAQEVVRRTAVDRITFTERIDNVVTHRLVGLPIFMIVMYLTFKLVIDVSAPFLDWIDALFTGPLTRWATALLTLLELPLWFQSLVTDGILAGVGGVLVFVPGLIVLYLFLAFLEDSGYLARAAFVMDRFMRVIGLHGKSVIPMILGFGCAVPAIYATRTIANRRDRILTALLIPFMSCSARLPVYLVFGLAFFGRRASTVIWLLYVLGIGMAIAAGFLFSRALLQEESQSAFVLELPPYRLPAWKSMWIHMWRNTREFIKKAGTTILALSIVLWFLLNLPWGVTDQRDSYFGQVSAALAPALAPAGFGEWEMSGSLITGLVAKEMVVGALSQIYVGGDEPAAETVVPPSFGAELGQILVSLGETVLEAGRRLVSLAPGIDLMAADEVTKDTALSSALHIVFSPLAAFAFLVFVLLYVPCIATIGAIRQEFGWRWAATSAVYQTAVAWLLAVLVYQGGRFLGFG